MCAEGMTVRPVTTETHRKDQIRLLVKRHRRAKLVIERHGEWASLYAAARSAVLAGEGDVEGATAWRQ